MSEYAEYIGRQSRQRDFITPAMIERYRAVIGDEGRGRALPYGLHWCVNLPKAPMGELSQDGHPETGGFLPASDLPRRMWASSEVDFLAPLDAGAMIERVSTIKSVTPKAGRSGSLLFVNVEHVIMSNDVKSIRETQTIVYREASSAKGTLPSPTPFELDGWTQTEVITPNNALLFRFSALTFNTHRIHYDKPYAYEEEGYPELVVHGPLMASLLLRFATQIFKGQSITGFKFRGLAPAFCNEKLILAAKPDETGLDLAIFGTDGRKIMTAHAGGNRG